MTKNYHIYALNHILSVSRHPVSRQALEQHLERSTASIKRDIAELRDEFGAPIEYCRNRNGYYYNIKADDSPFELPGLWFNSGELYALLLTHNLLKDLQPGYIEQYISPFTRRLESLLDKTSSQKGELRNRVRVFAKAVRKIDDRIFQTLSHSLAERCRISLVYLAPGGRKSKNRVVSPQRMVYYHNTWYLDAWCHEKKELRTFSVSRIVTAKILLDSAKDVPEIELDNELSGSYGIFSGQPDKVAILIFSEWQAQWVSGETWHPKQISTWLTDGRYQLEVPYSDSRELVMDILRYGAQVKVESPPELIEEVRVQLNNAAQQYI